MVRQHHDIIGDLNSDAGAMANAGGQYVKRDCRSDPYARINASYQIGTLGDQPERLPKALCLIS
jgi:hypothetical protein